MRWVIVAVAAIVVVAGALWSQAPRLARLLGGKVELARREVPGAALQFPVGKLKEERLDYQHGKLDIETGSRGRVIVEWNTGDMLSTDELDMMLIKPLREGLNLSVADQGDTLVAGGAGKRWHLRGEGVDMILNVWPCGKRYFSLTVGGQRNLPDLERSIRDSFECKPDPARDGQQSAVGVQLALGADFGVVEENPLTVMSLDGEGMIVSPYTGTQSLEDPKFDDFVRRFLAGIAIATGVADASFKTTTVKRGSAGARKVWRGAGIRDDQRVRILSTVVDCGAEKYVGFYLGPEAKPESSGLDLLFGARCSKNPKRPPPFEEVARKACARGDERGCE